jgi:hypothetical protein
LVPSSPASAPLTIWRAPLLLLYSTGLGLLAIGVLALTTEDLPIVVPGIVVSGAGILLILIAIDTAIQRFTPNELQGWVGTAIEVSLSVPQTMSIAIGAALVAVVDYRLLLLVTGLGTLGCGLRAAPASVPSGEPAVAGLVPEPPPVSWPAHTGRRRRGKCRWPRPRRWIPGSPPR